MKVGFFDSGVGGLSVWREAVRLMPDLETVYIADNANCPYGGRPAEFVRERSREMVRRLLARGCGMVVVACNTATAAAIDDLRREFPVPFVGMEPAVKPAALASRSHVVGVLATPGTLQGRLFRATSARVSANAKIVVRRVSGWVEAVERGDIAPTGETLELVRREISPLLDAGADSLVLGCTHFPFLREAIEKVAGPGVALYDPAPAVARRIQSLLVSASVNTNLSPQKTGTGPVFSREFYATGDTAPLERMRRLIAQE